MTAKDIILLTFGIGTNDDKIDDICENFDLKISTDDVEDIIDGGLDYFEYFQNTLIGVLYDRVIDRAVDEYGLSKTLFVKCCYGKASCLIYDNDVVADWDDIESHANHCPECGCVLKADEFYYDKDNDHWMVACCPECDATNIPLYGDHRDKDDHTIYDTAYGEVLVRTNGECYIGDNYDQYVGTIDPESDDVDEEIEKLFENN